MHIEHHIVTGAKILLSVATGAGVAAYTVRETLKDLRVTDLPSLIARSAMTTAAVFTFFQILPHFPVGVSEVHFILGSTLFLLFGAAPAAIGLSLGLLIQGLFFAPFDLPQYGMNMTTLLVPLFALKAIADRVIPKNTAYVDLTYRQAFTLSVAYQGGIVAWVAFWAIYGQGFAADIIAAVASFGAAYMLVVLIEPVADLAILAVAKTCHRADLNRLFTPRLYEVA